MRVHDGLTGGSPHVHTHVIPVRLEIGVELRLGLPKEIEGRFPLTLCQFKEVANVAERNNQQMPPANRIVIVASVTKGIPENNFL
jgi:hypothetical protein